MKHEHADILQAIIDKKTIQTSDATGGYYDLTEAQVLYALAYGKPQDLKSLRVQPVTGKSNRLWLEEEYADVYAGMLLVARRFGLRADFVHERMDEKANYLRNWHEMA